MPCVRNGRPPPRDTQEIVRAALPCLDDVWQTKGDTLGGQMAQKLNNILEDWKKNRMQCLWMLQNLFVSCSLIVFWLWLRWKLRLLLLLLQRLLFLFFMAIFFVVTFFFYIFLLLCMLFLHHLHLCEYQAAEWYVDWFVHMQLGFLGSSTATFWRFFDATTP